MSTRAYGDYYGFDPDGGAQRGFFQQVYDIVGEVPPGFVISYGQIAAMIGRPRGARIVGYAMRVSPDALPSHRVVKQNGELLPEGHAFRDEQRRRLEGEGVTFLPDGRVDMAQCRWIGL